MKRKVLCLVVLFILAFNIPSFASEIELQPTMISKSNKQDRVWAGTFQLSWNEFTDKYIHSIVRFREGTPSAAKELNLRTFDSSSISEKCYYKFIGKITQNTKRNILASLTKRMDETDETLDYSDLTPVKNHYLLYTMLKKDCNFLKIFDNLGFSSFGTTETAQYFGIDNSSNSELRETVKILFYNNQDDFAVMLTTDNDDEVYLYKNSSNKDFKSIFRDILVKSQKYSGDKSFGAKDELKVPVVKIDETKSFSELSGKRVMGTNIVIGSALETIKFNMSNKGVQLKGENAMALETTEEEVPKYFYFDNTFVIFLKEKEKELPYFALRVNDITKFQ